ncbi:MAG: universal stress protein [bacterium]|nr:universal stress protein [bacterium]
MSAVNSILVATDFSSHAECALEQATKLASLLGARVHLVFAVHVPVQPLLPEMAIVPADMIGQMREFGRTKAQETANKIEAAGVEYEIHIEEGEPSRVVLDLAERLKIDMIAVGRRGQSALEHVIVGSVAERLLRSADCPVLTAVSEGGELSLDEILVATDLSDAAIGALGVAQTIAAASPPTRLLLAYAHPPGIQAVRFLAQTDERVSIGTGIPILDSLAEDVVTRASALLDPARNGGVQSYLVTGDGKPDTLILETAEQRNVKLIVMGTHGRRGISHLVLGSVAERVVHGASCSVITARIQGS